MTEPHRRRCIDLVQPRALVLLCLGVLACNYSGGHPAHPLASVLLGMTAPACTATTADADRDGLDDGCELALAEAFAPMLLVDRQDCLWTNEGSEPRLGGGYLFAAQPTAGGVRLAFLPAYFKDCGWSGALCWFRGPRCGAHAGDSELIVVDVARVDESRWATVGVFLSAHCFGRSDGRCRWYRGADLEEFTWAAVARGAPRVWVARGKHAHYPSQQSCDRGHWSNDTCEGNAETLRFPVRAPAQNIGSRQRPSPIPDGCIGSERLPLGSAGAGVGTRECLWSPAQPFWGWQSDRFGTAPTPYTQYLERFAAF